MSLSSGEIAALVAVGGVPAAIAAASMVFTLRRGWM
jgi:hypothetical protein